MPSTIPIIVKKPQRPNPIVNNQNNQSGFTLIEMLVAISVFAMLSVAGWQVFEGLTRTKSSTKVHTKALSELQYAYLQVQNDVNQITAWQTNQDSTKQDSNQNNQDENSAYKIPSFFQLSSSQLSFIRYADPDPRYQNSPTLMKVDYAMNGDTLVRKQYFSINSNALSSSESNSLDSVLLTGVTNVTFEALNPESLSDYSSTGNTDNQQKSNGNTNNKNVTNQDNDNTLLPKGLSITFSYRDEPIEWVFALPIESPKINSNYQIIEDEENEDEDEDKEDDVEGDESDKEDEDNKENEVNKKDDKKPSSKKTPKNDKEIEDFLE